MNGCPFKTSLVFEKKEHLFVMMVPKEYKVNQTQQRDLLLTYVSTQVYSISYQYDGTEVPGGDFDDNIQLLCKIVREWGGWRQSLTILRQAIKNKTDFGTFKL